MPQRSAYLSYPQRLLKAKNVSVIEDDCPNRTLLRKTLYGIVRQYHAKSDNTRIYVHTQVYSCKMDRMKIRSGSRQIALKEEHQYILELLEPGRVLAADLDESCLQNLTTLSRGEDSALTAKQLQDVLMRSSLGRFGLLPLLISFVICTNTLGMHVYTCIIRFMHILPNLLHTSLSQKRSFGQSSSITETSCLEQTLEDMKVWRRVRMLMSDSRNFTGSYGALRPVIRWTCLLTAMLASKKLV